MNRYEIVNIRLKRESIIFMFDIRMFVKYALRTTSSFFIHRSENSPNCCPFLQKFFSSLVSLSLSLSAKKLYARMFMFICLLQFCSSFLLYSVFFVVCALYGSVVYPYNFCIAICICEKSERCTGKGWRHRIIF